uniref:Uncharacterized protein n=1 Tax=Panagrolaimus davidi TaxID=227884 RepID=A0A914QXQ2_9BILA
MGKQREADMAKFEKDKKRLGLIPGVKPLPKKMKKAAGKKESEIPQRKIVMAQFFPESGVVVEIPLNMIKTLYSIKNLLPDSKHPESAQKMIDRAKQRCLDNVTRLHPETSNILDDLTNLEKALRDAEEREKQVEFAGSSVPEMASSASTRKEKNSKDKYSDIQKIDKCTLDSSEVLSRISDTKSHEVKINHSKKEEKNGQKSDKEDDEVFQYSVKVPNLGETLKNFKIQKIRVSAVEKEEQQYREPKEKAKEYGELERQKQH